MPTTRVATTITNIKEGSHGALAPHNIAAMDALDTAREQLLLAREAGTMTYNEWLEALAPLAALDVLVRAGWYRPLNARLAADAAALAAFHA